MNRSQSGGSLEDEQNGHQPCSVSPCNSTEAAAAAANGHVRIMPVGILAKGRGEGGHELAGQASQVIGNNPNGRNGAVSPADFSAAAAFPAMQFPQLGMFPHLLLAQAAALSQFNPTQLTPQQLLGNLNPLALGLAGAGGQTATAAAAAAVTQVFKPMAVRYTNKEVQKFKKEWNGSFRSLPSNNGGENKLGTHIRKVYKQTKGDRDREDLETKPKVPAHSSLSNQSANTLTSL